MSWSGTLRPHSRDKRIFRVSRSDCNEIHFIGLGSHAQIGCHTSRPEGTLLCDINFIEFFHQPENLRYLSQYPDSEIKLIDFGFAARIGGPGEPTELNQICGTKGYMGTKKIRSL
jgi:hypothetical protein